MRLTRLQVRDFMAYAHLDLDFSDVDAVAITGDNNTGKSALQNAVTMALYGRVGRDIDQRTPDLLVRRGAEGFMVRVAFTTHDGHEVVVTREKPLGSTMRLNLTVDDKPYRGHIMGKDATLDETQARIEALVGLSYTALTAGPFMVQQGAEETSSSFMHASPRERKDLLIRLLGLDEFEPLHLAAKKEGERYEAVAVAAAARVVELAGIVEGGPALEAEVTELREAHERRRAAVAAAQEEVNGADIALATAVADNRSHQEAADRFARANTALEQANARLATSTSNLTAAEAAAAEPEPVFPAGPPDVTAEEVAAADEVWQAAQARQGEYLLLLGQVAEQEGAADRAQQARAILPTVPCGGKGKYGACQFLVNVPPEADVAEAVASLARTRAALGETDTEAEVVTAQAAWKALTDRGNAARKAAAEAGAGHREWVARHDGAQQALTARRDTNLGAVMATDTAATEYEAAQAAVLAAGPPADVAVLQGRAALARQHRTTAQLDLQTSEPGLRAKEARLAVLDQSRVDLEAEKLKKLKAGRIAHVYRTLAAAWHRDGVPTSIIEAAVPLIEAKANAILERLPEGLSIALRTQRPTKKGGMAERLDVIVSIGGGESVPGLLSVGANFRLDIATRLALSELRTSRDGARIGTLWLDEPLAALDSSGREAAASTVVALRGDFGLIVGVSHHDEFNDAMPARVEVDKSPDGVATAGFV